MANTSATGGPLLPAVAPAPLEGVTLEDFINDLISTLTGVSGSLLRPRWQPEPPNIPDQSVDWGAFGIVSRSADTFASEAHGVEAGVGYNELRRHEELRILVSFYGPNSDSILASFRDNLQLAQNREILQVNNMGLVETQDLTIVPELIKERWLRRVDMALVIRRQIVRRYAVLDLASSLVQVNNEKYVTTINV